MTPREFAAQVVARLQQAGHRALWAGGCVRDELLGLPPADYDVATDARPDRVKGLFRRCHSFGASFGVVEVLGPRGPDGEWLKVQVATFRSDGTYTDGRRPDAVEFSGPEEDARRRDFTINGMFLDPVTNRVIDYVGGRADLEARLLRAIGNPFARFAEDKLRLLRAVRMAARFELNFAPDTLLAAKQMAGEIRVVSPERIAEELRKLLTNRHRAVGVTMLRELGLVEPIMPELVPTFGEGWERSLLALQAVPQPLWPVPTAVTFPLAFAVVLLSIEPAEVGAIGRRLRLSNAEVDRTLWLVENQRAFDTAPAMRMSRLQPLLIHPGVGELLALHRAIATADGTSTEAVEFCERILRETPLEELNPPPLITGNDLVAMGLKPGPSFKPILDVVRAAQLDREVADREAAGSLIRKLHSLE